jgi:uncharacterized protein involved in exopolysaccharide biosynthesis
MPTPASNQETNVAAAHTRPRELDLFAYVLLVLAHLRFVLLCGLLFFVAMVVAMLLAKPLYSSTAVMIVPQSGGSTAALAAKLGAGADALDLIGGGYELYADIIQSRTVADRLIADFDLKKVYHAKTIVDAELRLEKRTLVATQREGVLRVTVKDEDPRLAAALANDYLHQLDVLNSQLALSVVSQERAYLEKELIAEKDRLADAEVALEQSQEKATGLPPEAEASADLSAIETTRVQLRAAQVRLGALLTAETEENPEVIRERAQIASLTAQLDTLQHGTASAAIGTPTRAVPAQALEYTRRLRDVKFHEAIFELLAKEFEMAKERESKAPSIVEVLDSAVPAIHKSWPPRTMYCLLALLAGLFAGVFLVSAKAFVLAYTRAPQNVDRVRAIAAQYRAMVPWGN